MNRRAAILAGAVVAIAAATELVMLSGLLAAEQRDDRVRYTDALTAQRRAAGRSGGSMTIDGDPSAERTLCVAGVDTFSVAAQRALGRSVTDDRGALDATVLAEVSRAAVMAERYAEHATGAPALPQRLGRLYRGGPVAAPDGVPCEGGTAYASARVAMERPAPITAPVPPSASTGKRAGKAKPAAAKSKRSPAKPKPAKPTP